MNVKPVKYRFKHVIGLTGPTASGKGLAVKAIREQLGNVSITSVLLSDYIREVVRAQGLPLNRETLRMAGNARRAKDGPGAWAQEMLIRLLEKESDVLIVDSIRNPGEIEVLREVFGEGVFILATDAPIKDRIARVLNRARMDDSTDPEEIEQAMRVEMEDNPETGFGIERCRDMADMVSFGKESKEERMREIQRYVAVFLERNRLPEARREIHPKRAA
jgi:dephospho-CoA kinase